MSINWKIIGKRKVELVKCHQCYQHEVICGLIDNLLDPEDTLELSVGLHLVPRRQKQTLQRDWLLELKLELEVEHWDKQPVHS